MNNVKRCVVGVATPAVSQLQHQTARFQKVAVMFLHVVVAHLHQLGHNVDADGATRFASEQCERSRENSGATADIKDP